MSRKYSYTPFLKFKSNEIAALSVLSEDIKQRVAPFLDVPRKDDLTRAQFEQNIEAKARKAKKWLSGFPVFFVDTLDIPDSIAPTGQPNYGVVIREFTGTRFAPVVGLDRSSDHNSTIIDAKKTGSIGSEYVALRLQPDEFASFGLVEADLDALFALGAGTFKWWIVVFDCRLCLTANRSKLAADAATFALKMRSKYSNVYFVLTGSSIPATIADIAKPQDEATIARAEIEIFHEAELIAGEGVLNLGDYTIVSPYTLTFRSRRR